MAEATLAEEYGKAIIAIGRAEGAADRVTEELYQFSRAVDSQPELRAKLTDASIPMEARGQAVSGILERAHPATGAVVQLLLGADRIRNVSEIADAVVAQAAEARGASVAEVRTAKPLSDSQRSALSTALAAKVGRPVDLKVTVDPDLLGGLVVQLGDTVIDGSSVKRLTEIKSALASA